MATLGWPSIHACPLAPKAALAAPNTKASITASPTRKTVALPTHITLLTALLNISCSLSLLSCSEMGRSAEQTLHPMSRNGCSVQVNGGKRIPKMAYLFLAEMD